MAVDPIPPEPSRQQPIIVPLPLPLAKRQKLPPYLVELYRKLDVPQEDWGLPSGKVIAFAHALVVPAGKFVNRPLRLRLFQIEFIRDLYNHVGEDGRRLRRQAVLSMARRNGKTLIASILLIVHLAGPMKKPNSTIVSAATTRRQAGIVFKFVAAMVKANPSLRRVLKVISSSKTVSHRDDMTSYQAISADVGGAFGEGIDFCVYDEMAQTKTRALYDALMTSFGSQSEPLMVVISTQAPANDHLLSELIDYGLKIRDGEFADDSFTVHLFAADAEAKISDQSQWSRANPGLGDFRDGGELATLMLRAEKIPSLEATVKNLYLNMRVQAKAPFLTSIVWKRGEGAVDERLLYDRRRTVCGGLDLSARTDLSSLVLAVDDDDGNVHLFPRIWTPDDTLDERALTDRAPYRVWANQNLLIPVPGQVLDYDWLATDIGELCGTMQIARIAYDRWRIEVLRQAFARLGIALVLVEHGQGYKDMSPAIETFEELAINGHIRHGGHPVLRWCVANCVVETDPARNRKLVKGKSFGRIDAAIAAVMAVAALRHGPPPADISAMIG